MPDSIAIWRTVRTPICNAYQRKAKQHVNRTLASLLTCDNECLVCQCRLKNRSIAITHLNNTLITNRCAANRSRFPYKLQPTKHYQCLLCIPDEDGEPHDYGNDYSLKQHLRAHLPPVTYLVRDTSFDRALCRSLSLYGSFAPSSSKVGCGTDCQCRLEGGKVPLLRRTPQKQAAPQWQSNVPPPDGAKAQRGGAALAKAKRIANHVLQRISDHKTTPDARCPQINAVREHEKYEKYVQVARSLDRGEKMEAPPGTANLGKSDNMLNQNSISARFKHYITRKMIRTMVPRTGKRLMRPFLKCLRNKMTSTMRSTLDQAIQKISL